MWREAAFDAVLVGGRDGAFAEAIEQAGGRLAATLTWGDPVVSPADTLIVLDASDIKPDLLDAELPGLTGRADIVCCTLAELEQVAAALLFTDAQLLCEPGMADRIAALAVAAGMADSDAAPAVREGEGVRLKRFSGEVARIAAVLARLAADEGAVADRRPTFDAGHEEVPVDPKAIRAALRARRLRDTFFGAGLFEDPAWDMLLDLFAAELEGGRVSVSSLCIAAAVAPTTALRWIGRLADAGLIERRPDPGDRRRAFIGLSLASGAAMRGYFAALQRQGLTLG